MVSLTERGLETRQVVKAERPAMCVFEHIYFSRPDSRLEGKVLQQVRGRMGEILWRQAPVEADLVISVPDSGNPAAAGFARASGLPRDDGLIKNRYVARTFIQPGQELRKHGLRLKFNPLPEIVSGQRIVVVDDSIVRGNTTRQIVGMLRDAGATEVHLRISAPPIRNPCHYGVDMSTREEMIAHKRTVEEIADELDADSLAYLSLDGVYEAIGGRPRTTATPASAATTRLAIPRRRTASSRSRISLWSRLAQPRRGRQRGDYLGGWAHLVDARHRLAGIERAGIEQRGGAVVGGALRREQAAAGDAGRGRGVAVSRPRVCSGRPVRRGGSGRGSAPGRVGRPRAARSVAALAMTRCGVGQPVPKSSVRIVPIGVEQALPALRAARGSPRRGGSGCPRRRRWRPPSRAALDVGSTRRCRRRGEAGSPRGSAARARAKRSSAGRAPRARGRPPRLPGRSPHRRRPRGPPVPRPPSRTGGSRRRPCVASERPRR